LVADQPANNNARQYPDIALAIRARIVTGKGLLERLPNRKIFTLLILSNAALQCHHGNQCSRDWPHGKNHFFHERSFLLVDMGSIGQA